MIRCCPAKLWFVFFILSWNCYSTAVQEYSSAGAIQKKHSLAVQKIKNLLDHGADFLYRPESYKTDLDSARLNFNKAFVLSHKINDENLKHKCLFYYGELLFEEK